MPGWHLLLSGPAGVWEAPAITGLCSRHPGLAAVHHLTGSSPAQQLVRPDGHIGYRAGGTDLTGLVSYLERWLPRPSGGS